MTVLVLFVALYALVLLIGFMLGLLHGFRDWREERKKKNPPKEYKCGYDNWPKD